MGDVTIRDEGARLREILAILYKRQLIRGFTPERMRLIIEDLGPTYVKLGQIVSMHSNILPKAYCQELEKLRSNARPLPVETVKEVIERELKKPIDEIFQSFEEKPLGSASMAQVHKGVLHDGTKVVIKIQRPGIYDVMLKDTAMLHKAAKILKYNHKFDALNFDDLVDEMWNAAQEEMNFLREADNLREFAHNLESVPYCTSPKVYMEYTTNQVIVMDLMEGYPIDDVEKVRAAGLDPNDLGEKLIHNYLKQVLDDGFFHADPHPGNVLVKGDQIAWIDMGMMGRLSKRDRDIMRSIVEGLAYNDTSKIKDSVLAIGTIRGRVDHQRLYMDIDTIVTKYGMSSLANINLSTAIGDIFDAMGRNNIGIPKYLMMLVRGFSTIEGVIASTAPNLNILEIMEAQIKDNFWTNFDLGKEALADGMSFLRSLRKTIDFPGTASDLMKMFVRGQGRINMDLQATNGLAFMLGTLVRDLIIGLIMTGLLVGSSLICTTNMTPTVWGIPLLAFFGFLFFFILGVILIIVHKKEKKHEYD